ncbi:hypothetical protein ACFLXE_03060 [Chloroflexota bacterium]
MVQKLAYGGKDEQHINQWVDKIGLTVYDASEAVRNESIWKEAQQ